jgi:hypothetical protein
MDLLVNVLVAWVRGGLIAINGVLLGKYLEIYHGCPQPVWAWGSAAIGAWAFRAEWRRLRERAARKSGPGASRDKQE